MATIPLLEHRRGRLFLALLAGAGGVFCFAPFDAFWLAPLVCGALFALLRRAASTGEAAGTGFAFGLGLFLAGTSWIHVSLSHFGGMPWWLAAPATLAFCALLALYPALAGGLFRHWQPRAFWPQALFFATLISTVDWLRGWLFTGFPWLALGYSQTPPSPLAGFAPVLGVFGLSFLTALSGALLLRWRQGLPVLALLSAAGLALQQHAWTQPSAPPVRVALIQGNIPQDIKFDPDAFFQTLAIYHDLVARHPATLTLLPETALPTLLDRVPPDYLASLEQLARHAGGDLVLGVATGNAERYFNSAISLGHSPRQVYSKQHLVPFGEFIPAGFDWFMRFANIPMSSFSRGGMAQAPLAIAGQQVAINICYEDAFGDELLRSLPAAGILANLSNTAWFGDSLAQPQHLQIARMRALETGRPMLRATNTGMTAVIDPDGRVRGLLPPFTRGVLEETVTPYGGLTPFARWGNLPALCLMALAGLLALRNGRK